MKDKETVQNTELTDAEKEAVEAQRIADEKQIEADAVIQAAKAKKEEAEKLLQEAADAEGEAEKQIAKSKARIAEAQAKTAAADAEAVKAENSKSKAAAEDAALKVKAMRVTKYFKVKVQRNNDEQTGKILAHDSQIGKDYAFNEDEEVVITEFAMNRLKDAKSSKTKMVKDDESGQERSATKWLPRYTVEVIEEVK